MRRLTDDEIQRYAKLARRRNEKNLLRKAKADKNKKLEIRLRDVRKERYLAHTAPIYSLEVPSDLSLETNYDSVVSLVEDLRYIALTKRARVGINFRGVKKAGSAASLYLAAEIYRCRQIESQRGRVTGRFPEDEGISKLLRDMGFNKLLNIGNPTLPDTPPPIEYIRYKTSNDVKGELARELREAIEASSSALAPEVRRAMYGGLTEAMTNVLHHAYPREIHPGMMVMANRWWMAGSIDHTKKQFMMMFYDQGVGIPVTVPRKHAIEIWGGILSDLNLRPNDANMIKAATLLGRSQTGEEHRGFGLRDIMNIVRVSGDGTLRIMSNRGEYRLNSDGSEHTQNHRRSIGGTLIEWRLSNPENSSEIPDGT